jgi:hypothetical protein
MLRMLIVCTAMRHSGSGPSGGGSGRGVVTWESRAGALCLGELSPGPSGGYEGGFGFGGGGAGGSAGLVAGRSLALLPQEQLLQVRARAAPERRESHAIAVLAAVVDAFLVASLRLHNP